MADEITQLTHTATSSAHAANGAELVQLVVFTLDNEEYAVPITDLQEIIKVPEVTPVPNSPSFVKGILNLRGKIVVVIDLEDRFQLTREGKEASKHIIITEIENASFGVVVDEVIEVLTIAKSSIQPTPTLMSSRIHTEYLSGVVVLSGSEKKGIEKNQREKKVTNSEAENTAQEGNNSRLLILINLAKILAHEELSEMKEIVGEASGGSNTSV